MEALAQQLQLQQKELNQTMVELQRLEVQFQESRIVKEELNRLDESAKIYKLIGPVLVPQEKTEADVNVSKRLEFITSQKTQVEQKIKSLQDKLHESQVAYREQQIKSAVAAQPSGQAT